VSNTETFPFALAFNSALERRSGSQPANRASHAVQTRGRISGSAAAWARAAGRPPVPANSRALSPGAPADGDAEHRPEGAEVDEALVEAGAPVARALLDLQPARITIEKPPGRGTSSGSWRHLGAAVERQSGAGRRSASARRRRGATGRAARRARGRARRRRAARGGSARDHSALPAARSPRARTRPARWGSAGRWRWRQGRSRASAAPASRRRSCRG